MRVFLEKLASLNGTPGGRRTFHVPYDQLTDEVGPLAATPPKERAIVLIESLEKPTRRPYHKQKLALLLANQRQFALEQARLGVHVRYLVARTYADALEGVVASTGSVTMMDPAERELRVELAPLVERGAIDVVPHAGFLTSQEEFERACPAPPYRMDAFYRAVRRRTGWLMERGKPIGGAWSLDAQNRKPWRGTPPAAVQPSFALDDVAGEVVDLVETRYGGHPGQVDRSSLPNTKADAVRLWTWAKEACLTSFGPFEDAMSTRSTTLFHTRISALLNLHRLTPRVVCEDALRLDVPLASKEGFLRQILGWREYVRHVHRATDGFRRGPGGEPHARPSHLGADGRLPPAFWGAHESGLACLDHVVGSVWREAYSHHITRLMVLSNLAVLLDVSPRELTDWFWIAYADAYDWVVEPNVLGMGTFATGDVMTTKPYVAGAGYISKMSDYCKSCAFSPTKDCPVTPLYWAFLGRHEAALRDNPRLFMPLNALRKRSAAQRGADAATFDAVRGALDRGERLAP